MHAVSDIPACSNAAVGPKEEDDFRGDWTYRAAGGPLWLSTMTRTNTTKGVRAVARHTHNTSARHSKAVLKILVYKLGTYV